MLRRKTVVKVVAVAASLLLAVVLVLYYGFATRSSPHVPLTEREIGLIAEHFSIRFKTMPSTISTWFGDDGYFYRFNVRADFESSDAKQAFEAEWLSSSSQVDSKDKDIRYEFSPPVPAFITKGGESWQALPILPDDSLYRQPPQEDVSRRPVSWALIRTYKDGITLYLFQTGNMTQIKGLLREVLSAEPLDLNMGWGVPSNSSISLRTSP